MIYLANLFFMALWMIALGEPTFKTATELLFRETRSAYSVVWAAALAGWSTISRVFQTRETG